MSPRAAARHFEKIRFIKQKASQQMRRIYVSSGRSSSTPTAARQDLEALGFVRPLDDLQSELADLS